MGSGDNEHSGACTTGECGHVNQSRERDWVGGREGRVLSWGGPENARRNVSGAGV